MKEDEELHILGKRLCSKAGRRTKLLLCYTPSLAWKNMHFFNKHLLLEQDGTLSLWCQRAEKKSAPKSQPTEAGRLAFALWANIKMKCLRLVCREQGIRYTVCKCVQ